MKKKRIIYLFLTAITCMTIFVGNKFVHAIETNSGKTTHPIKRGKTDNLYLEKLKTKIMKNASSKEELNNVYNEVKRYKKKNLGTIIINLNTKLNGYYTEKKYATAFLLPFNSTNQIDSHYSTLEKIFHNYNKQEIVRIKKEVNLKTLEKNNDENTNERTIQTSPKIQTTIDLCKKIFLEQNNLSDIFEHISDFNIDIDNFVIKNLKLVKDILKEKMKKNSIKDQALIEKLDNKYMYLIEKFDYDDKEIINLTIEEAKIEILKQKAKSYQDEYLEAKVDTDKYENLVSEVTRVKEKNNK